MVTYSRRKKNQTRRNAELAFYPRVVTCFPNRSSVVARSIRGYLFTRIREEASYRQHCDTGARAGPGAHTPGSSTHGASVWSAWCFACTSHASYANSPINLNAL